MEELTTSWADQWNTMSTFARAASLGQHRDQYSQARYDTQRRAPNHHGEQQRNSRRERRFAQVTGKVVCAERATRPLAVSTRHSGGSKWMLCAAARARHDE